MKIGIICYPTFGGSGVVATELAHGLAERGHEIHLVSYAPPVRLEVLDERICHHEVEVSSYPLFRYPPYSLALASRLADIAEEVGLDLIHAHYAIPHALAALLVRDVVHPRRLAVVTTLHGTDITIVGRDPAYARIMRHAISRSDAVTSVSEYLREKTCRIFGANCPIVVIPNFVDAERFRPCVELRKRARSVSQGEYVLIHVGNFRPVKRAMKVIEAFAHVARSVPACLLMVGDGPERAVCEARVQRLHLQNRVRFLGVQAGIERLLPRADLLLLPSEYESFGLAALEAMACGVVPVATRAGGLLEVIEDGVDGLLVPEENIDHLGERVVDLLRDAGRLQVMKREARRTAVERFRAEVVVPRYEALYARVLAADAP